MRNRDRAKETKQLCSQEELELSDRQEREITERLHPSAIIIHEIIVQKAFAQIGLEAMAGDFWMLLLQAIFAGWLIALMVWLLPMAESSQLWVIIIITAIIGLGKLPYIIAGSVEVFYVAITGATDWAAYFRFAIPTLVVGNILGGGSLVSRCGEPRSSCSPETLDFSN